MEIVPSNSEVIARGLEKETIQRSHDEEVSYQGSKSREEEVSNLVSVCRDFKIHIDS